MLAERKGERRKRRLGERIERKGWIKWSNPSHSWDNSWYHSNWHGKTYGLEVDPWAAVEPVPYLCAVSLKPSCEEFPAPKHVKKGHCTNTLQLEDAGAFDHENRFSLLAFDDDEKSLGENDVAKPVTKIKNRTWKIGGERDDGFSCRDERRMIGGQRDDEFSCHDERVDECMCLGDKVTCHRPFNKSHSNAHHVSYLAKSEVDSKGVNHVTDSGWKRVSAIMDTGSTECVALETIARNIPLVETFASRQGQTYHSADGGVVKNKGEKTVTMYSEDGDQFHARHQISGKQMCCSRRLGGWIINHETGRYTWFPREHGVYVLHSWVNESFPRQECWGSAMPRDTWSQRSL